MRRLSLPHRPRVILELRELVMQQAVRIQELEDQLAKNNNNSGKPPSSDGLKKKPAPKSLRVKGKRKSGGQPGHTAIYAGTGERAVEHIEVHRLSSCPHCQHDLSEARVLSVELAYSRPNHMHIHLTRVILAGPLDFLVLLRRQTGSAIIQSLPAFPGTASMPAVRLPVLELWLTEALPKRLTKLVPSPVWANNWYRHRVPRWLRWCEQPIFYHLEHGVSTLQF